MTLAQLYGDVTITILYNAGTYCNLIALPKEQVSGLNGIMQAIQTLSGRVGVPWLPPVMAALLTINAIGGVGGWFAATARLPFVAGVGRFFSPALFAPPPPRRAPDFGTPLPGGVAGPLRVFRP